MLRFCLRSIYSILGYFRPSYFLHLQAVSPSSKFRPGTLVYERKNLGLKNSPSQGESGENKTWANTF